MTTLFYILGYAAVLGFFCMAYIKVKTYLDATPLHVRWELYPVPHEGEKAAYGGSFMEETDWWTKPRHVSHWGDVKALLMEVLFLHATYEHNRKLWQCSYPFHFGLYMLMGGTIIMVFAVLAQLFGLPVDGVILTFVGNVINACSLVGGLGIAIGGICLIQRRRHDEGLRRYTTPEMFFNLGIFVVFAVLGLLAWAAAPSFFTLANTFLLNLFTGNFASLPSTMFTLHLLVGFFLMIWIPTSQMGHLFMKYFTFHDIRWGDVPTNYSEANKHKIAGALKYNVTWSAKHINPDGQAKTWVDVATSSGTTPKQDN